MKTKDLELKEVIKEAILEAFAEMYGVATLDGENTDDSAPEDGDGGSNNGNSGNNGSGNNNGGGSTEPTRPKPVVGVGGFSLR